MTNLSHAVREAAGSVIDPELRRSLAELGMIGAVSAENGVAQVEVRLTIAGCPAAQKIESDVRAAAASVRGVTEVAVDVQVMTAEQRAELLRKLRPGGPKQNPFGPGNSPDGNNSQHRHRVDYLLHGKYSLLTPQSFTDFSQTLSIG